MNLLVKQVCKRERGEQKKVKKKASLKLHTIFKNVRNINSPFKEEKYFLQSGLQVRKESKSIASRHQKARKNCANPSCLTGMSNKMNNTILTQLSRRPITQPSITQGSVPQQKYIEPTSITFLST